MAGCMEVGQEREGMDDIAEGSEADKQDTHGATMAVDCTSAMGRVVGLTGRRKGARPFSQKPSKPLNYPCTGAIATILRCLSARCRGKRQALSCGRYVVEVYMIALFADIAPELTKVGSLMREQLHKDEPRVAELVGQLGEFNGKMLRPALLLLMARGMGEVNDHHRQLAAALELIHTATLVHDDMIEEEVRRGKPTPHVSFGNSTAILLGDFFYTRAFDLVAGIGDNWMTKTITATTNIICEGEPQMIMARRGFIPSRIRSHHLRENRCALAEMLVSLSAANGDDAQREAAGAYGVSPVALPFRLLMTASISGDAKGRQIADLRH